MSISRVLGWLLLPFMGPRCSAMIRDDPVRRLLRHIGPSPWLRPPPGASAETGGVAVRLMSLTGRVQLHKSVRPKWAAPIFSSSTFSPS